MVNDCLAKEYGSTRGKLLERSFPLTPFQELLGKRIFGVAFAYPKVFLYPHGDPVSLRFGHARGLTPHCGVIQDPHAASLPHSCHGVRKPLPPKEKPPWRSQGVGGEGGFPTLCDFGQMLPLGDICRVRPSEVRLYICTRRTSSAFEMVSPRIENIFKFQFIALYPPALPHKNRENKRFSAEKA